MTTKVNISRKTVLRLIAAAAIAPVAIRRAHAVDATVKIDNFAFSPSALTVKVGTKVTWTNQDDIPHTVDATAGAFKSGALDTDQAFSFTFAKPGTYQYFCALHPHMTGTIVVVTDNPPS